MSASISDAKVSDKATSTGSIKVTKTRKRGTGPSRPKPMKALLSLREHAHYARLKIALKQGSRIDADVNLAQFCKPLLVVDEEGEGKDDGKAE